MSATDAAVRAVAEAIWAGLRDRERGGHAEWGGYVNPEAGIIDTNVQDMSKVAADAVAAAAPRLKAEAWDEGFQAANEVAEGCHDCIGYADSLPRNPYRADLADDMEAEK